MDDEGAAYLRALESRYIALRGSGLMLSARDIARVQRWREAEVPLHVALRVLDEGTLAWRRSQRRVGAPRSLSYFEKHIKEVRRHRAAMGLDRSPSLDGDSGEDSAESESVSWSVLLAALEAAGKALSDEPLRAVLRQAWRRLLAGRQAAEDIWTLTAGVDAAIVSSLEELLGAPELEAIDAEVEAALAAKEGKRMSEQARRERHRFEVNQRVRARAGVPDLMEVLLEQSL